MNTAAPLALPCALQSDEKAVSVMIYTQSTLTWGEVVLKEAIRAATWLRTQAIPQFIRLYNTQTLRVGSNSTLRPVAYPELYIPSAQVIAYHIKPPAADPIDYDPSEPMRKMDPVTALVGDFRFDGCVRMSVASDLDRFLDVIRETFFGMYDLSISLPTLPAFGQLRVPFALVRCESVLFSSRPA